MYHSITFGEKNSWDDWRLIPSARPLFNAPAQKTKTLDIPGGDGQVDLSQALTGYPVYQNRTGSFEFYVMNDFKPWEIAYSDIMDYLHGKNTRAVLEDDPDYFYEGRFAVNAWKSEKDWSRLVIDYNVAPYKQATLSSLEERPDLFRNIALTTAAKTLRLQASLLGRAPVCPKFIAASTAGNGVRVRFINATLGIDETKTLPNGTSQAPEFIFYGDSGATVQLWCSSGTGSVSIDFRRGRL